VFVSHAWRYRFADLLAALQARFGGNAAPGIYLWLGARATCPALLRLQPSCDSVLLPDALVSSQHKTERLPQDWWSTAFATAIRDIGHTVLVVQPWHAPAPLTRSWCLWEIFSTLDAQVRLEVLMPPAQAQELHAALDTRFDTISAALSQIDTRRAEAEKPEDKEMIDAAVAASEGGFYAVNSRILESLREWLLQETREVAAARIAQHGSASTDALTARANLARLLGLLGHTAEAAMLCSEVAAVATATYGLRSVQALAARGAHADALAANGELQAAVTQLRAVMLDQELVHAGQPEHAASQVAYARVLVAYCACAARGVVEVHSPPPNIGCVAPFQALLAWCLVFERVSKPYLKALAQGRLREVSLLDWAAWALLLALAWLSSIAWIPFLISLNTADNFIAAWRSSGYLQEAVTMCRAAHAVLARRGPALEVFTCAALLGRALRDAGSLDEAEPLLCNAAQGLSSLVGESHMQTMAVHADLADLLRERGAPGDFVVAESIFRSQAPRLEEQLGAGHPDALCARINLAICVAWRGDIDAAKTMLQATGKLVRGNGDAPDLYAPAQLQYIAVNGLYGFVAVQTRAFKMRFWKQREPDESAQRFRLIVLYHLRARLRRRALLAFSLVFLLGAAATVFQLVTQIRLRLAYG
jgi:hypothetical protein